MGWVWDISNPFSLAVLPPAMDQAAPCDAGGRFGAGPNHPVEIGDIIPTPLN